ncbi:MAG TPA: FHA domain-containing protein [Dehalococcoidia bacterium]
MPANDPAPGASGPEAYVVVTGEGTQREVHRLRSVPATIGRSPDSDVLVNDPRVSRSHARIDFAGGTFVIEDLGSTNGTTLNGEPISAPEVLTDGDVLSLAGLLAEFQVNAPTVVVGAPTPASGLQIDLSTHEVSVGGKRVELSPKEFLFLAALYQHSGSVVAHADLAREVWPEVAGGVPDENIHQLATRLRRKLEDNAGGPRYVLTVKGFGYRLAAGS